jgi:hypothetical protein
MEMPICSARLWSTDGERVPADAENGAGLTSARATMTLAKHTKNCTPLLPCVGCQLVAWLRSKLAPDVFRELVEYAEKLQSPPPEDPPNPLPATTPLRSLGLPTRLLNALSGVNFLHSQFSGSVWYEFWV